MSICIIGGSKNEQDALIAYIKKMYTDLHKQNGIVRIEIYDLQKSGNWNEKAEQILQSQYGLVVVLTNSFKLIPSKYLDKFNELYCKLPQSYYDTGLGNDIELDSIYQMYKPKITQKEYSFMRKLRECEWLKINEIDTSQRDYEKIFC